MNNLCPAMVSEIVKFLNPFETANFARLKLCRMDKILFIRRVYANDHVMSAEDWLKYFFWRPTDFNNFPLEIKMLLNDARDIVLTSDFSPKSINKYSFSMRKILEIKIRFCCMILSI